MPYRPTISRAIATMRYSGLTALIVVIASDASGLPPNAAIDLNDMRVFYDHIEAGVLRGGMLVVEPHASLLRADNGLDGAVTRAAWAVTTIIDNGDPANRIDLIFLGDGYTQAELGIYAAHVENVVWGLFSDAPLASYSSYFNVHRIDVVSNESGVDEPDQGIFRDTALDMRFGCGEVTRLLCIDTAKVDAASVLAPDVDLTIALANSSRYGGAAYTWRGLATVAADNAFATEIALHELGHAFAGLGDEYFFLDDATFTGPEPPNPNISIYESGIQLAQQAKWFRWLDMPIVGSFEGASLHQFGIYRPVDNSKMRSLGAPFGPVNVEQFILSIYSLLSPMDRATPPSEYALPAGNMFYVTPLQPADRSLSIQWSLDGLHVSGGTGLTFLADFASLEPGIHEVSVSVLDDTPSVRDEAARGTLMTATRQWQIRVVAGDGDGDNDVDLADAALWQTCFSGDADWTVPPCDAADVDDDLDVDLADFLQTHSNLRGPLCGAGPDCDANGILDSCDVAAGAPDCNENDVPDDCDIEGGQSIDRWPAGGDGIPDECQSDFNE